MCGPALYAAQSSNDAAPVQNGAVQNAATQNANTQDWTKKFSLSKFGGFVMGNPDAEVRISEYVSYTCSHCATFEVNQAPVLKAQHISKGNVSLEIRNHIRDPLDFTIAILARCGGQDKFFDNHALFMREQGNIITRYQALSPDERSSWSTQSISDYSRDVMKSLKLDMLLKANGHSDAQIEQCVTNEQAQQNISQMTMHSALIQRIAGTPAFVINDEYQPSVGSLETLAPYLNN